MSVATRWCTHRTPVTTSGWRRSIAAGPSPASAARADPGTAPRESRHDRGGFSRPEGRVRSCDTGRMFPAAFTRNVVGNWGEDGRRWLERLPRLIDDVARDWGLTVGSPYPLSFNYVAPARRADGSAGVLKLGPASAGHLAMEAGALEFFGGHGAVE